MSANDIEQLVTRHATPVLVIILIAGSSFLLGSHFREESTPVPPTSTDVVTAPPATDVISSIEQSLSTPTPTSTPPIGFSSDTTSGGQTSGLININSASAAELDKLPGIGPTKAQAIIDYRNQNGPFKSVNDLEKVKGIGPATVAKLKNQITI